jgi:hypothetical protein
MELAELWIALFNCCLQNIQRKHYRRKDTFEIYNGQICLNCGKVTDNFGNELIYL